MVQPLRQSKIQTNSSNSPGNHQSTNQDINIYIFLSLSQILLFMLHWGPLDPLRLRITNKLLFSTLIPNEHPLTPFYPRTTQSPLTSDLRR